MYIGEREFEEFRNAIAGQQECLNGLMDKLNEWRRKGVEVCDAGCQTEVPQLELNMMKKDEEDVESLEVSVSLDNTVRSCMATPRRIENERLRVIEELKRMEWDTEVQFVGSADDFTDTKYCQVYIIVTLATFYKVACDGSVLYEIGSECIISIEIFDDTQFISIGTTEDTDLLLYLHADAKSTSSLRLLDVINEYFLYIPTIHSPSMDRHMSALIQDYQKKNNRPEGVAQRKVNLRDDLVKDLYIYTVNDMEGEEEEEYEEKEESEEEQISEDEPEENDELEQGGTALPEEIEEPEEICDENKQGGESSEYPSPPAVTAPPPSPLVSSSTTSFESNRAEGQTGKRSIRTSIRTALQMRFGKSKESKSPT